MNTFFTILKKPLVHTIGLLQVLLLCFSVGVKAQTTPYRPLSDTHSDGGLLCVGTFTSGESKAYDLDPNSYATLQNDVGLACFAEETVQFGQTAKAGDSILVYLGTGGGLLDATLLANATLQAKNSGTNVGSPIALNSALLNLQLLSGGTKALVKFPVSGNTNQIQIKAGGLLSLLVTLRIYDIQLKFENPTVVGGLNKSICSGQSTTVTTTTTNGTTLDWYDVPSGGIALQSNTNSFTTPIITVDKIFYIQVNRAGGGNEERLPVKINVINPSAPIVNSINICSGSATTLSVSSPKAGETYNWYSAAAAGSLLGTGSSFTTPVLTSNQSYYVETAQSSCISASRTQVDVTVNALPAPAVLQTSDVTINANQTASLEATAGTGEVVDWYDSASGGTLLHTGSPFVTPALNTTTTYYAVARNSSTGCSSTSRQSVTVQVNAIPSSSCLQADTQNSGISGVLCVLCSVQNPGYSVDNNSSNYTQLNAAVGVLASVYQRLVFPATGIASDSISLDLELPSDLVTLNLLSAIQVTVYNGSSPVQTFSLDASAVHLTLLAGNQRFLATFAAGGSYDRVEVRVGALASVLSSIRIYGAAVKYPTPSVTGNGSTVCIGQTATLSASPAAGLTLRWYDAATGGTLLAIGNSYTTPSLNSPTTYFLEVGRGSCVNVGRTAVQVKISNPQAPVVGSTGTNVCSGSATTLSVSSPQAGETYNWYSATAAGSLLGTGSSFTTPVLTSNQSYYVETAQSSCISASRTQVDVTVNALPAPAVLQTSDVTINANQTASLEATVGTGEVVDWYDSASGGTLLHTGSPFVTPALNTITTYYAVARNSSTGCSSTSRQSVTVQVNTIPSSSCLQADTQNSGISGVLCVLCSVQNPGYSVDNNPSNYTQLNAAVGVLASVYQRLVFPATGIASDSISLDLELPSDLVTLNLLSAIQVTVYNGSSPVQTFSLDASAVHLTLLAGNQRFLATFAAGGSYDRVEVRVGALASVLSSIRIYGAAVKYPTPSVTGNGSTVCIGQTATLSASPAAGLTLRWYDAATGGTLLAIGNSYTTPALNSPTTYFLEVGRGSCVNAGRTAVQVKISNPQAPVVGSTGTNVCSGSATTLSVSSPQAGETYNWYSAAVAGSLLGTGSSFTTPVLTSNQSYYVETAQGSCLSPSRTEVDVMINNPQAPIVSSTGTTICSGSVTTLSVSSPQAGETYNWYSAAVSGSLLGTGNSFTTPVLTSNQSYYVETIIGSCNSSSRTKVTVIVNDPQAPTVQTSAASVCAGQAVTATITNPQIGVGYNWYKQASGGAVFYSGTSLVLDTLTASRTFYVEAVQGTCISPTRTAVTLLISPDPAVTLESSNVTICSGSSVDLKASASSGVEIRWYTSQTGGSTVFTGNVFTTPSLTSNTTYYVEGRNTTTNCVSLNRVSVKVNVQNVPPTPIVNASTVSICSGSTATLTATSTVTGVTFNWYDVQSGGTLLATGASYSTPVLTTDKTYYVESVFTSSGCNGASARVAANVQVVNQPPTPIVVSPLTICAGQRAMLEAQSPTGGILYKWYTSESGGSPIYVGSMYETPIITSTTKYYVEASLGSGSCGSSSRSEIVINVNALPNAPIVTTSTTTILSGATATLMASVSQAGIVIDWYTSPVGGAAIATGTSYTTPPLNGSTSYYVEARNLSTGCVSSLRIETKVIVDYNSPNPCDPTPPSITTPNLAVCKNQPFVITASANNTIYWYDAQTGGNLLAVGQTYAVNGLSANATYYAETKDPDCSVASLRVPAMVSVLTNPPAPTVDFNNISVCKGETFTIKASSPFSGVIFKWYSTSAGGTSMFTGDYFTTPPVTSNTSYYVEALLSGGCTCSCRTEVKLSVAQPLPSPIVRCVDSPSNTITFGWDPIPGATGYQVSVNDGIYTAPTSGVTGTTHVITGVMPGEGRTISVIALANPACSNSIASVVQSCSADDYVDFFIPNAFSPNHDGNNDVLFARGTITKIKFKIYNQWGQLLFESNDHNKGWDGTFSGKEQPIGVYVYVAQATLINGKEVMKKGSINLIR